MKASVSSITSFSSCRRRFWFDQTYRTPVPSIPLWTGQVVHAGLEGYYRGDRNCEKMIAEAKKYALNEIARYESEMPSIVSVAGELTSSAEDALGYLANYGQFDNLDTLEGTVERVELPFRIPTLTNPTRIVSGRIDLVLRSPSGGLCIVDHKTMGTRPNLSGLDVDEQITAYAWAAWRLFGEVPDKVVYNVLVKTFPQKPRSLARGGLSKDKTQSTTYSLYLQAIEEIKADPSDYADILDHLARTGWGNYFARVESSRNEAELRAFDRRAATKIRDIEAILARPDDEAYPSPSSFTCGFCPYLGACKAKDDGGDWKSMLDARFVSDATPAPLSVS